MKSSFTGEIKTPSKLGICQEGNEELFAKAIVEAWKNASFGFNYLEIGLGGGETAKAVREVLLQLNNAQTECEGFWMYGLDINVPGSSAWNLDQLKKDFGTPIIGENSFESDFKFNASNLSVYQKTVNEFLCHTTGIDFDLVFIDGCHGAPCAKSDFIAIAGAVVKGGLVIFHDASPSCQGHHHQAHCGTGIDVRKALQDLGLLGNKLRGWDYWGGTNAQHGIEVFRKI